MEARVRDELKYAVSLIGLGISLIAYAHSNFANKEQVDKNTHRLTEVATKEDVREIGERVDKLREEIIALYRERK
jgi:polyhydroxyalkanoate synthesis regulator phasin